MSALAEEKGTAKVNRKILSISSKRQITIPQKFYQKLGFDSEAECIMQDGMLIIRPVKTVYDSEFSEQILEALIKEGLSGEALLTAFKKRQTQVKAAVRTMTYEARCAAEGKCEYETYEDVFGTEK